MKQAELTVSIPGIVREKYNADVSLPAAIYELVDNSIDADATHIEITKGDDLTITDNGHGFDNIMNGLKIGESHKGADQYGRYGVGLNIACTRFSNKTEIYSKGKQVHADWQRIIQTESTDNNMLIDDCDESSETVIILRDFKTRAKGKHWRLNDIQKVYKPKIDSGSITITVDGEQLNSLPTPVFTEYVEKQFSFKGKTVEVKGGIFDRSDPNGRAWRGYNPYYLDRMIGEGGITNRGTGSFACDNFSFQVNFIDGKDAKWQLSTNKDAIADMDDVIQECYLRFGRELIKKASEEVQDVSIQSNVNGINDLLQGSPAGNQTRKNKGGKKGSVKPTGEGKQKVKTKTATQEGSYKRSDGQYNQRCLIKLQASEFVNSRVAECTQMEEFLLVKVNTNNRFVAQCLSDDTFVQGHDLARWIYCIFNNNDRDTFETIMLAAGEQMTGGAT